MDILVNRWSEKSEQYAITCDDHDEGKAVNDAM